ncbi:hypothetical protein QZH41_003299 [Actinostola sp. cb2023]|nr:hypothetical protein QZH41_003299 [Actinostola sp. cb2023]
MLNRAYNLSSSWDYFSKECERLKDLFCQLQYPARLVDFVISQFLTTVTAERVDHSREEPGETTTRIVLPFKDQKAADSVRRQLKDLGKNTKTFSSSGFIEYTTSPKEANGTGGSGSMGTIAGVVIALIFYSYNHLSTCILQKGRFHNDDTTGSLQYAFIAWAACDDTRSLIGAFAYACVVSENCTGAVTEAS